MIDVKEHVQAGPCTFRHVAHGKIWYRTALGFDFSISAIENNDTMFHETEPGSHMENYILQYLKERSTTVAPIPFKYLKRFPDNGTKKK